MADTVRTLRWATKACAICLVYEEGPQYHGARDCPRLGDDRVRDEMRAASPQVAQWLRQVRLAPYAGCDVCLLP